ncbi:MAG: protein kinase, partial [Planctomycetaceae bacterium]
MDEQSIFAEALERDPAARPAYLDAACGDNPSLRRRLDVLLREYEHAGSFLERPVAARPDSADAPEALAPADGVLGDFRILREIGRGGMGVVYEAEQISLKRRVALKVLPFAAVLDKRQLQRFRTEAMAAGRLHHPHIVPVYQVGCERAVHFYAMQYVEGRNVSELLEAIRSANTTSRARQEAAHERSNADPEATQIER